MLFIVFGLTLSLGVYLTSWGQAALAPTDLEKLVAEEAGFIQKTLAAKNIDRDRKSQRKMRLAALMIAQYAQGAMARDIAKNRSLATLRDQALAVRRAIEDGKFGDAKQLAVKLSVNIAANPDVKTAPVDLTKLEEFEFIENQYSPARLGGLGLADFLNGLINLKANPNAAEAQKIDLFGKKLSMIALLVHGYIPPNIGGSKNLPLWQNFSKTMQENALNLSRAALGKQAGAISKAAVKLANTCSSCHEIFKD